MNEPRRWLEEPLDDATTTLLRSARELDAEAARAHHLALTAGGAEPPGAQAASAKAAVADAWLVKLGLLVGIPLIVAAALLLGGSGAAEAPSAGRTSTAGEEPSELVAAPLPSSPPAPPTARPLSIDELPAAAEAPSLSPRGATNAPSATASSPAPAPHATLADEVALLGQARAALVRGDGPGCLAELDRYAREFPRGALSLEASVLRIEALFAAGRRDEGRAAATAFLARSPDSAFSPRLRALAGLEGP